MTHPPKKQLLLIFEVMSALLSLALTHRCDFPFPGRISRRGE